MPVQLHLKMRPQPTGETCGPTCLHALYRYYRHRVSLEEVIADVPSLRGGGTLGVMLALDALRRGYQATIYSYNLQLFDPTWFGPDAPNLRDRLIQQRRAKRHPKLRAATDAYLEFLGLGGELRFEDLTRSLIRRYLDARQPILTGLSSTFLYRTAREVEPGLADDDIRGEPQGHFVLLCGYDRRRKTVRLGDPLQPNPLAAEPLYDVPMDRVIGAILLGILTYDANLLILRPR
jgi:hypothetical protein